MSSDDSSRRDVLTYAVITPARNESANLPRLADSLLAQTIEPSAWIVVDHGSTDDTGALARQLAAEHAWIRALPITGEPVPTRGGPIVQAFTAGLEALEGSAAIVVKLDADVSFAPDHFERLLAEFVQDESLGIASSTCWELEGETWLPRPNAREHVRGAVRAYRRLCLEDVTPLEQRFGWDTIDELKAQLKGWRTRSIPELAFFHHRSTGERDGSRATWTAQGELAWYLGYRFPYLALRTLFRMTRDPHAISIITAWARAGLRRSPRFPDAEVRRSLRDQQRLSQLSKRAREVGRGRAGGLR